MSKVKIQGNASGTGVFTIEAPGTNDPRTLTLPDSTGTLLDENSSLPAANLTGTVATARLGSGTADSTTFLRGDQTYATAGVSGLTNNSNTTWMTVSSDEEVTMPLQPCFLACLTSRANNVTGAGTQYSTAGKTFTEIYDIGSNFSNGTFTAPVTGKYIVYGSFYFVDTVTNNNQTIIYLQTSNRIYNALRSHGYNIFPYQGSFTASVVADMDASDTFHMTVNMYGHSSNTVDVDGTGTPINSTYMGAALIA